MPRTLAIGDIHGCDVALGTLLDRLQPAQEDTVVVLGDIVDRGPGTRQVIETLMELKHHTQLVFIRGNHEDMMLSGLQGGNLLRPWMRYGGQQVVDSYGGSLGNIPIKHIEFLASSIDYHTTPSEIFVHANLKPGVALEDQPIDWLRWEHLDRVLPSKHESGRRVICGHTSQKSGLPISNDDHSWICIDTFAHGSGYLTALDVENDIIHQTDQQGSYRGNVALMDIIA